MLEFKCFVECNREEKTNPNKVTTTLASISLNEVVNILPLASPNDHKNLEDFY